MEPFQQYLAETLPENSKRTVQAVWSTSVNAHLKTLMALGKLPHVRK